MEMERCEITAAYIGGALDNLALLARRYPDLALLAFLIEAAAGEARVQEIGPYKAIFKSSSQVRASVEKRKQAQ